MLGKFCLQDTAENESSALCVMGCCEESLGYFEPHNSPHRKGRTKTNFNMFTAGAILGPNG